MLAFLLLLVTMGVTSTGSSFLLLLLVAMEVAAGSSFDGLSVAALAFLPLLVDTGTSSSTLEFTFLFFLVVIGVASTVVVVAVAAAAAAAVDFLLLLVATELLTGEEGKGRAGSSLAMRLLFLVATGVTVNTALVLDDREALVLATSSSLLLLLVLTISTCLTTRVFLAVVLRDNVLAAAFLRPLPLVVVEAVETALNKMGSPLFLSREDIGSSLSGPSGFLAVAARGEAKCTPVGVVTKRPGSNMSTGSAENLTFGLLNMLLIPARLGEPFMKGWKLKGMGEGCGATIRLLLEGG